MAHACNEPLATIGRRVHHAFIIPKDLMNVWKMQYSSHMAWENESQRFELWATNLGLYHQGHSSLDYRFRDAASLYNFASKLLQDLENCLATGEIDISSNNLPDKIIRDEGCDVANNIRADIIIVKGALEDELLTPQRQDMDTSARINDICVDSSAPAPPESLDEDDEADEEEESFDSYQVQSLTEIAVENIGDVIDRLYRLAFKIRSPATRLGFSKAEKYRDIDEDTNVDLIDVFGAIDRNHVVETFSHYRRTAPEAVVDDFLVLRLAKANTRRRQQFGQWRRHKINLDRMGQQAPALNNSNHANSNRARMGQFMDIVPVQNQLNPSQPSTATRIDQNRISLDDNTSVVSTSTYAMFSQEAEAKLSIPRLSTNLKRKKEFECPYCHVLCSRRILDTHAWETHVLRDLRPYVCTYEDCKQADQQYDSYQQWVSHETRSHEPMQLQAEQPGNDLSSHHTHANPEFGIPKNEPNRSFFHEEPKQKRALLDKHRQCPICTENSVTTSHVGFHLQKIALFALPRSTGLEDDQDQGDSEDSRLADMNGLDSLTTDEEPNYPSAVFPNKEENQEASALSRDALRSITDSSKNTVKLKVDDYLQGTILEEKYSGPISSELIKKNLRDDRVRFLMSAGVILDQLELDELRDLGVSYSREGKLKDAEKVFKGVLTRRISLLGPSDPLTLADTYDLAIFNLNRNRLGEAETLLKRALTGYEKSLGLEHKLTLQTARTLGELYSNQGRLKEAEVMDQQALSGYKNLLGEEHLDTLSMLRHLAIVYHREERFDEAEKISRRALVGAENLMGLEDPFTLNTMRELAIILEDPKEVEAEDLYRRVLKIREEVLRQNHPDTINSVRDLAQLLESHQKHDEAEILYRRALQGFEKICGEEHKLTLDTIGDLARSLLHQKKYAEAEIFYRRALQGFEKTLGEEHLFTNVIEGLATSLFRQGKYEEAEILYRRALQGVEKNLGEDHEETLLAVDNLTNLLYRQGKYDEMETLYRRALPEFRKSKGEKHKLTREVIVNLGVSLQLQGKYDEFQKLLIGAPEYTADF